LAVSALEPKFWRGWVVMLGLDDLAGAGFATGDEALAVVEKIESVLAGHDLGHWLELAVAQSLPVSLVNDVDDALVDPAVEAAGLLEILPTISGDVIRGVGSWLPGVGRTPRRPAPVLGEHTEAVLGEMR
jgi:crotonobetainyl-CoA:carnitine CoA-transferase CaiB-like acyl-CoA transferase